MKITLNGKVVDTDKALPLQLRDLRRLKNEFKVDLTDGVTGDPEKQHAVFFVVLQKANKEIASEDVDDLTIPQMNEISADMVKASRVVDVPPSASSTS